MLNDNKKLIHIKSLNVIQANGACFLSDLSFSIYSGEVLAIIGHSGCGKSSLLHTIMNALPETLTYSGSITSSSTIRMALIPQRIDVLNPTAKIGAQLTQFDKQKHQEATIKKRRIDTVLSWAQLPPSVADSYPHQLSGGMAKRVLSALAFIQEPDVILADEPSCGVNDDDAISLLKFYKQLAHKKEKAIVIVSHNLKHLVDIADRILVLSPPNGTTLQYEFTTPEEIRQGKSHPYSQSLWKALPDHWSHDDTLMQCVR